MQLIDTFGVCGENSQDLLTWQLSNMQISVMNDGHHAVYQLPRTYSSFPTAAAPVSVPTNSA